MITTADANGKKVVIMDLTEAEKCGFCHADFATRMERCHIINEDGLPDELLWPVAIVIKCVGDKLSGNNDSLDMDEERDKARKGCKDFWTLIDEMGAEMDMKLSDIIREDE